MEKYVSQIALELQALGIEDPGTGDARERVRKHIFDPLVSPQIRDERLQKYLELQSKWLHKKVFRPAEPQKFGTVMKIVPYKAYVRWGRQGSYIVFEMLRLADQSH